MARQVLRPKLGHSLPIVVLSAAGTASGLAVAVGLIFARNLGAAGVMAAAGVSVGGSCLAYFRNAAVWADDREIAKVNLLGTADRCPRGELIRVDAAYAPQPTINFIRADGTRAFRLNARLGTDDQVRSMQSWVVREPR